MERPVERFDLVCCTNALDHVEDIHAALQGIKAAAKPDGFLLLTVDVFADIRKRNEGHPYSFTVQSLATLLWQYGFRIEWSRLSRRKIGMIKYAEYRLRRGMPHAEVIRKLAMWQQLRSYGKQLLRRGALGELVVLARAV